MNYFNIATCTHIVIKGLMLNAVQAFKNKRDSLLKIKQKKMDSIMKNKDKQIINDIIKNARHF